VSLADLFLDGAGPARERLATPGLEAALGALLAGARAAWPDVGVTDDAFLRYLAERIGASPDPVAALAGVHGTDLLLACGCAFGDAQALRAFDERFLEPLTGYLRGREPPGTSAAEIKQAVRASVLVSAGEGLPRIANYGGQGPLAAWLRIVAVRTAGQIRRTQKEHALFDADSPMFVEAPGPDPELAYLKTRYRAELQEAFRATLGALAPRDRTILRLHFIDGLNADAIATAYKVSKRTAERWLAQTRSRILDETRQLLGQKLQVEPSQLDTLMGLVQSEIDVSIYEILGPRS
jgi:RNA polymerase sigma-70 factor (ECF subfamily)